MQPPSSEVVSVVEIAAPPGRVLNDVVSLPRLPPPTEWLFRVGVAAPERARIEVGVWQEGRLLAFDIARQAPPMQEWSPYRDVNPPHLDGYFRATHGEFRLDSLPGGRTRPEGRTHYTVNMFPQGYWAVAAGSIVSAIHLRVLRHIKRLAEGDAP